AKRCPAEHETSNERDRSDGKISVQAITLGTALAPREPGGDEDQERGNDAERCLDSPPRIVRHRLSPAELQLSRRVVEQPPVAPDRALKQPLPRLIEGFDVVDLPALGLGCVYHPAQYHCLIGR